MRPLTFLIAVWLLTLPPLVCGFKPAVQRSNRLRSNRRSRVVVHGRGGVVRGNEVSKRQARVGQVMREELAVIVHSGSVRSHKDIEPTLRERISIVDVHMSPDLRSAKVYVSIFGDQVEVRQAYSWLVKSSKAIRHSLAQNLRNMKGVPELFFRRADLSDAVEVMRTIDELAADPAFVGGASGEEFGDLDFDFGEYDFDEADFDFDELDEADDAAEPATVADL